MTFTMEKAKKGQKMLGNTQKRLFWQTRKTGLGTFWAQSGHIEENRVFLGILKRFKTAASH